MTPVEAILFVFTTSAKALLVLTVAYAVTRAMRSRSAAERHVVWMLAAVCVLLLPALALGFPLWRVGVPSWLERSATRAEAVVRPVSVEAATVYAAPRPASVRVRPAPAPVPLSVRPAPAPIPTPVRPSPAPAPVRWSAASSAPVVESSSTPDRSSVAPLLLLVWLTGFLVVAGRLVAGSVRVHRLTRGARPLLDPALLVRAHGIAAETGLTRSVRFLEGDANAMPITFGVFRPTLLLPSSARTWTGARQVVVLRHELAHVRRRDSLTQLVAELGCAVYWFNPLMWHASRRMCVEREHACDDAVLLLGARASDYAAELVDIAGTLRLPGLARAAAIGMARRSHLRARVTSLLDAHVRRERASPTLLVPACIGAFLLLTPLSSLAFEFGGRLPETAVAQQAPAPRSGSGVVAVQGTLRLSTPEAPQPDWPSQHGIAPIPALAADPLAIASLDCLTESRSTNVSSNRNGERSQIKWSGPDCSGEVIVEGTVEFDDRFERIVRISRGGEVRITTDEDGTERRVTIRPASAGVSYEYSLNGDRHEMDAAAHEWLSSTLLFMFRRMGFMASERATSILQQGGTGALLAEVDVLEGDYTRSRYLEVLVGSGDLDDATLNQVLTRAGRTIDSDYYLTGIITQVVGNYELTDAGRDAYIRAIAGIESDYYTHNALAKLLSDGNLSPGQMTSVLDASQGIESDYYRAQLLEGVAALGTSPSMRTAYLNAASDIESDYYRTNVLMQLMSAPDLTDAELASAVAAAAMIESGYYRHSVLSRVAQRDEIGESTLIALIDAASGIDSDHYQAGVLIDIANNHQLRGEVRSRFEGVVREMESDTYRGRVASALLRN